MLNHVLSFAAFGVVAFVLVFVHPVSHANGTAVQQVAAHGSVVAPKAMTADARSRLAASK